MLVTADRVEARALVDGDVAFALKPHEPVAPPTRARFTGTPFGRMVVDGSAVAGIAAMRLPPDMETDPRLAEPLSRSEACQILNLPPHTAPLPAGERGPDGRPRHAVADVLKVSRKVIGAGEVAFRRGWVPAEAPGKLAAASAPSRGDRLWCRTTVDTMLADGRL